MKTPVLAIPAVVIGAFSLATVGSAQVTRSGSGYDIKVKYVAGKSYNYALQTAVKMTGAPQGAPGGQAINMSLNQKVLSVKGNVATLRVQTKGGPNGDVSPQTVQVDNRGKIVGGKAANAGFNFMSGFPARPVKVGERWTSKTAMPMGPMGQNQANVAYVFRGLKSVNGKQAAQIDFTITMAGQASMKGNGTAYLNPADGQLISSNMKGNVTISGAAMGGHGRPGAKPMVLNVNVSMKRV